MDAMKFDTHEWIGLRQAALWSGLTRQGVMEAARAGKIRTVRTPYGRLYSVADVNAYQRQKGGRRRRG
jgi:hypothetical protein